MNHNSLVTVICTCFNHQNFVIDTIKSVLNQSYSNIEIIIIDDKSSDNSVSIISHFIKDYPQIKFIKNNTNIGNTKTFNKAAKFAKGSFLIDLACDDLLLEKCVEIQLNAFLANDLKTTGIVFGNSENINRNGEYLSTYFSKNEQNKVIDLDLFHTDLIRILKGGLCMNSASSMINKTIFDELKGYDESLAFEDLDYWIRILERYNIVFIDEILTQKRDLKTSLGSQFFKRSKLSDKMDKSMNRIFSKVISNHKNDKNVLKAILKRIHYSLDHSIKNRKYSFVFIFGLQKVKLHYLLLFAK